MNPPVRLIIGALFGILYATIIAMGYLTSNGSIMVTIISTFFGAIMMYVFYKFLTEGFDAEDDDGDDDGDDDETED